MLGGFNDIVWRSEPELSQLSRPYSPALVLFCLGVCLALGATQPRTARAQRRWAFQHEAYLEKRTEVPIDVAVGSDGFVAVADIGANKVLAFRSDGTFLWGFGEPDADSLGLGRVSLVDVLPSGDVAVYDSQKRRVILISRKGQFISGRDLPFRMGRVDDIVGLKGGGFALAGRTLWPERGADTLAVHVFSEDLRHLRSFGPVPELADPELRLWWGVGSLHRMEDGNLMFGRKLPYEILTFTPLGQILRRIEAPFELPDVNEASRVLRPKEAEASAIPPIVARVQIPSGALPFGQGLVLSQRTCPQDGSRYWDIFDAAGSIVQTKRISNDWLFPFAVSPEESRVYVLSEHSGQPAIAVVTITIREGIQGGHG